MIPSAGFDRDLSIAGRAMVQVNGGSVVQELVKVDRPSTSAPAAPHR